MIRERFGARHVFVDARENEAMIAQLLDSGWGEIVYEDDEARIIRIREEKGVPTELEDEPETEEEKRLLDEEERKLEANANANAEIEDEPPAKAN